GYGLFITDSGLETTLVFHEGIDLPCFAAFPLLDDATGLQVLRRYYGRHALLARVNRVGLVLEAPTWRANADWGDRLGFDADRLHGANVRAIALMAEIRGMYESPATTIVISGNIRPRGDGYVPSVRMSATEA